jgi:HlyD family secretion protein
MRRWLAACVALGCAAEASPPAVGTLERDRIELVAEASEPIVEVRVREGQDVAAGQLLLRLDGARFAALLAGAEAARERAAARLAGAEGSWATARHDLARSEQLLAEGVESRERHDAKRAAHAEALAARDAARAALVEAEAALADLRVRATRLAVLATRAGRVDALPFELGDRPPAGATVAVLLADAAPYARVFVPEALRARVAPGTPARVRVDGVERTFEGRVRTVSGEAAFTPYYALTERDRGRLVYPAEVDLVGAEALPTGLPVEVSFDVPRD